MNNNISKLLKQVSLKFLLVIGLFLGALFLFIFIANETVIEKEDVFDLKVHQFVFQHTTPGLIEMMRTASFLGSSYFLFPAYLLLIGFFVIKKKFKYAIDIGVIAISSFLLMILLKQIFHRNRPDLPIIKGITSYSFPSGHSLSSFVFCSILGYVIWKGDLSKPWKLVAITFLFMIALIIGMSRVVLNVHYATDVIAGFCFGIIWVILSFWLSRYFFPVGGNGFRDSG